MADPAHLPKPIQGVEASRARRLSPLAMVAGCAFGWLAIAGTTDGAALAESGPDAADLTGAVSVAQQLQVATGPPPDPKPGDVFRDCPDCPEMVVVPAGTFVMGSPEDEKGREISEGPQHEVKIARPFAVGVYEVTFAEWDVCAAEGGCNGHKPSDEGWGRLSRPVINVSWDDARAFVAWLSKATGQRYRLLSEAEWEYVARAGTRTRFWWGDDDPTSEQGNFEFNVDKTTEVGTYPPNPFGLHDTAGNVLEWVEDVWHDSYGAPSDGSAWGANTVGVDPDKSVLRGGSWGDYPRFLRSANRLGSTADNRLNNLGFRVARTL